MERHGRSKLNTQIYEEACEWFVELRAGDLDDSARREFDRWLRKSPEHLSAYLEIAAIWNEGPSLDPSAKWDVDILIAQAGEGSDNVIALPRTAEDPARTAPVRKVGVKQRRLLATAASLLVFAVAVSGFQLARQWRARTVATTVGEQRSIVLADGSTVELNSRSSVKVRYSKHERAIDLLEGQALFRVAKDPTRPFVVNSGTTRVHAVGTQFDVYRKHDGTVVTVVEGRVAVLAGEGFKLPSAQLTETLHPKILLSAGEQITVTRESVQREAHPNVANATAWRQRQLVFESASLVEVAEEFNRYNERQFIIDDAQLDDFHISGVFSSTDPSSLIRFLLERPDVRVTETASEIRVARNNSQKRVTDR